MRARTTPLFAVATAAVLGLAACSGAAIGSSDSAEPAGTWEQVESRAQGQTVSLWMWGGDQKGNAYVDDVLAPAAAARPGSRCAGCRSPRPGDAMQPHPRRAAGRPHRRRGRPGLGQRRQLRDRQGRPAPGCAGGPTTLPNMALPRPRTTRSLSSDFGTAVEGCEVALAQGAVQRSSTTSARVPDPPTDPDRRTRLGRRRTRGASPTRHPRTSPDRYSSAQALVRRLGRPRERPGPVRPGGLRPAHARPVRPAERAGAVACGAQGRTYPRDSVAARQALRRRRGRHDDDLRPGDAAPTSSPRAPSRHDAGAHPRRGNGRQRQLPRHPVDLRAARTGRKVVANLALSPAAASRQGQPGHVGPVHRPRPRLAPGRPTAAAFDALPSSPVVPRLRRAGAQRQPGARRHRGCPPLDEGWRRAVLGASS